MHGARPSSRRQAWTAGSKTPKSSHSVNRPDQRFNTLSRPAKIGCNVAAPLRVGCSGCKAVVKYGLPSFSATAMPNASAVNAPTSASASSAVARIVRPESGPKRWKSTRIRRISSNGDRACAQAIPSGLRMRACMSMPDGTNARPCAPTHSAKSSPASSATPWPASRRPQPSAMAGWTSPRVPSAMRSSRVMAGIPWRV